MRIARIERKTGETDIKLELNLDGTGQWELDTGIGFFDHMLSHIAAHGLIDLRLRAVGDLEVDGHHTVEDVGIVIGSALRQALGDRSGIVRYGQSFLPMDEALALVALDFSNRGLYVGDLHLAAEQVGGGLETGVIDSCRLFGPSPLDGADQQREADQQDQEQYCDHDDVHGPAPFQ